jgi:uncharacterized membrane protein
MLPRRPSVWGAVGPLCGALWAMSGCGGSSDGSTAAVYDVYLVGGRIVRDAVMGPPYQSMVFAPCYWKNGVRVDLNAPTDTNGRASRLYVSGSDVYATGGLRTLGGYMYPYHPCYWKNQERVDLSELDPRLERPRGHNSLFQWAGDIALLGSDVYITGQTTSSRDKFIACYWRNGTRTDLVDPAGGKSSANAIQIVNGDIYIVGSATNAAGVEMPCYWRNGVRTDLSALDGIRGGYANAVEVVGTTVHIVGGRYASDYGYAEPCYWRNGVRTDLPLPAGIEGGGTSAIRVSGNDIYISGTVGNSVSRYSPCYWKNGVRVDLPVLAPDGSTTADDLVIAGGSLYIAGTAIDSAVVVWYPCYWKDGVLTTLGEKGSANGLQVVAR